MGSSHFQYEDKQACCNNQLFQGDVLERTPELEGLLKELYPYAYQNPEKYPFFIVLTQSCDLVANDRRYRKAEHITLCATRSIRLFLEQEISKIQIPVLKEIGVCLTSNKPGLLNKLERLLSNEEFPYFYLHPSAETPFNEPHVAYLRITFPLRSDWHYDVCLKTKRAQLAPEFQAKLGWLTTLVFGRVATKDFLPEVRKKYAKEYIDTIQGVEWRKAKALLNEAKKRGLGDSFSKISAEKLQELIVAVDEKSQPEAVSDMIVRHARIIWPDNEEQLNKFRDRLLRDPDFQANLGD
ncbi:MAG: hypothetical protein ABSG67_03665 [Thermoguttaceae bacterium]|jgi:hypothetical protein